MLRSWVGFRGTEEERFWRKVRVNEQSGCWEWTASGAYDYGSFTLARTPEQFRGKSTIVKAHNWAYEYLIGPIPKGLELDHTCRNPACVNPEHLEPVTPKVNGYRSNSVTSRNAQKIYCKRGHKNWRYRKDKIGRECITCMKEHNAKRPRRGPLTREEQRNKILRGWITRRKNSQG